MLTKTFQSAHPLLVGCLTSVLATLANYVVPDAHAAEAVAVVFLLSAVHFALPKESKWPPQHFGLSLGGLFEAQPLAVATLLKRCLRATLFATAISLLVLPPYFFGFVWWFEPQGSFSFSAAARAAGQGPLFLAWAELSLVHIVVVALPEEAFFRGYLQTALADRWPGTSRSLGAWASALLVSSALFAVGHIATSPSVSRLAVFFPSLLFGVVRDRTGSIAPSVILHAQCNLFSAWLSAGYFPN